MNTRTQQEQVILDSYTDELALFMYSKYDAGVRGFSRSIERMNAMYELPIRQVPAFRTTDLGRVHDFKDILREELDEIDEILAMNPNDELGVLVALADLLGDLTVYIRSEALRFGIPLEEVLSIIMASNFSKLDENGKPIKDERGKFLKGPNYWKPEPKIRELLLAEMFPNGTLQQSAPKDKQ